MDDDRIHETMDNLSQLLDYSTPEKAPEAGNDLDRCPRVAGGANILLYGVPGSGKSYTIHREYCSDEECMERIVFHPDYTYSDFVGQILPGVSAEGAVRYAFTPGPFTRLLHRAYTHPDTAYFLIIEEINRGNAPAIFGDIFQLLDRLEAAEPNGLQAGTSAYPVTNASVAAVVYGDPEHKVRIPSNLSILGTMNTSDQNVFTLDTAFQRRWDMRIVTNTFENHPYADTYILDTQATWRSFCQAINREILENNVRMTSSEDKRLGVYFVARSDLRYNPAADDAGADEHARLAARRSNGRFAEKVLKYLWDDAFKFSREDIFDTEAYKSLEAVTEKFQAERGNDRFAVFIEGIRGAILAQGGTEI